MAAACATLGLSPVTVLSRCNRLSRIVVIAVKLNRVLQELNLSHLTVRWRLTLLYSLIFLVCAAVLLAITYWLFANFAYSPPKEPFNPVMMRLQGAIGVQRSIGLHRLRLYSEIALAFMVIVSVALGWLVAGRALAPVRTITATTDRISDTNLHERIAMGGPRDELRVLADTIDRLLQRLEIAFEAQRRFVANASHELRTPLAMMRTTLDVAVAKPGGVPEQTRHLDAELRVDLDHADRLLEGFLSLARAQNGRLDPGTPVALEPLITTALFDRADQIAAKHLSVETQLATVKAPGSGMLLGRMVENVIENAVRHTQPGGSIEIALEPVAAEHARIVVDSSGPVLDQHAVSQLAQPFRRISQDRVGSQNGHGLGLSIVAAVAAAHNGRLDLEARAQGGLRVQITLPLLTAPELAETTA